MSKRPHKYRAVPTVIDGIRFASKKEAARYGQLKMLEKAGEISGLLCQPRFELSVNERTVLAALKRGAARLAKDRSLEPGPIKIGSYVADFSYWQNDKRIVEDVKGFKTPLYRWKKKHVEAQYSIEIREV
jgi:dsDNA-binding SOS-regulon protein